MILMPKPQNILYTNEYFLLKNTMKIMYPMGADKMILTAVKDLKDEIKNSTSLEIDISAYIKNEKNISIYIDGNLKSEAYELSITKENITVKGDKVGCFYGIQTLRQIVKQNGAKIPTLEISDYSDIKIRAVYHDITRGKIPTLENFKKIIDRLAGYKINQFQFYIENVFPFDFNSETWSGNGKITAYEIIELDEYCKNRNIELVPSMASFGHLYDMLVTKQFSSQCELYDAKPLDFYWTAKAMHHTLDVSDEKSFSLVKNMIDAYLPLFSSNKFNICCDETFDLATGKNKDNSKGKAELYFDFVMKIAKYLKQYNKKIMMWGDIILKHQEYIKELDNDFIVLNWGYSPDVTEENSKLFSASKLTTYSCPSTQNNDTLLQLFQESFCNILKMVTYTKKYNLDGVMVTNWGDKGHTAPVEGSFIPMIYTACIAWNTLVYNSEDEFKNFDYDLSILEYGDMSGKLVGLLREGAKNIKLKYELFVFYYYDKMGYYPQDVKDYILLDSHYEKSVIKSENILESYEKIQEIYFELTDIYRNIKETRKFDLQVLLTALKGCGLLNLYLLFMKEKEYNIEKTIPISYEEIAINMEYWLEEFTANWLQTNKMTQLNKTIEIVKGNIAFMREYDKLK